MSYTFNPFTGNLDVTPFSLDGAGKIPSDYLPSYVDDVVEYDDLAGFPGTGETGKIYVAKDTGYTYRWTGSVYVRIGSGGEVELNLGSEGSPSLFFNGDANTGLYSPGADQVAISTNGTERLRIDSSGNVGIGTSSPDRKLSVSNTSGDGTLARFIGPTNNLFIDNDRSGIIDIFSTGSGDDLAFGTQDTERLRIDSSGRLLVGTSSGTTEVAAKFQARAGTPAAQGTIMLSRGAANPINTQTIGEILFTDSNEGQGAKISAVPEANWATNDYPTRLVFSTSASGASSPTERMRINSSGNVGIGTTSPSRSLTVGGDYGGTPNAESPVVVQSAANTYLTIGAGTASDSGLLFADSGDNNVGVIGYNHSSNAMAFAVNAAERARIDSSGRLLVGTSSAQTIGNGQAQIEASTDSSTGYALSLNRSVTDIYGPQINFRSTRGTAASPSTVNANDQLGSIAFYGYDGTDSNHQHASIAANVDGTPGSNDCPGRLTFSTTADGASSPTERLRIDSSGNVKIQTNDVNLEGVGTLRINSGSTNGILNLDGGATNHGGEINLTGGGNGGYIQFRSGEGSGQQTERMRIDSSGNLIQYSVATLERQHRQQASSPYTATNIRSVISGPSAYLAFDTDTNWTNSNAKERMRIDSSGKVGIGTSAPSELLTVAGQVLIDWSPLKGKTHISDYTNGVSLTGAGSTYALSDNVVNHSAQVSSSILYIGNGFILPKGYTNTITYSFSVSGGAFSLAFESSTDGVTWTTLTTQTSGQSGPATYAFSALASATALRFRFTNANGTTGTIRVSNIVIPGLTPTQIEQGVGIESAYRSLAVPGIYGFADTNTSIQFPGSDVITFNEGGSEAARIDSSGRLLVGTSSTVSIAGSSGFIQQHGNKTTCNIALAGYANNLGGPILAFGASRSTTVGTAGVIVNSGDILGDIRFAGDDGTDINTTAVSIRGEVDGTPGANDMPGRLVFATTADGASSPTERVRINAAGGFKWSDNGTYTSPTDAKVEFRQSTNVEGLSVRSTNASFTSAVLLVRSDRNASGGEYNFISAGVAGVDTRFIVSNDGDVTNINNSYGGISDIKLKENIVDATSQWDDIKALRPVNYNFKEGQTHTQLGLIAQEVELVSPGLVSESPDRDEEGTDLGTVTKSVNYSVLYMKAVKALQEAMERIETLEAKVAALEAS